MCIVRTVFVVCTAIAIVFEAGRINGLHDLHLGIGKGRDSVRDFHITKAKNGLNGFRNRFECVLHRGAVGSDESMAGINAALSGQVLNFCNIIGYTDGIEVFLSSGNCLYLINSKGKIAPITVIITFTEYIVISVILICAIAKQIKATVTYVATAHTEGRITVCYEDNEGRGILAYLHMVCKLKCLLPVCTASGAKVIYPSAKGRITVCEPLHCSGCGREGDQRHSYIAVFAIQQGIGHCVNSRLCSCQPSLPVHTVTHRTGHVKDNNDISRG